MYFLYFISDFAGVYFDIHGGSANSSGKYEWKIITKRKEITRNVMAIRYLTFLCPLLLKAAVGHIVFHHDIRFVRAYVTFVTSLINV